LEYGEVARAARFSVIARRNNSLTSTGRLLVFGFLFVVSIGIAAGFAALGAWPVLPFAGVEMLVLYVALRHLERHAADYERIEVAGDSVGVERCEAGHIERREFNRCWAQVVIEGNGRRVALRSHGREYEFGRHLCGSERLDVACELRRRLREPWGAVE